MIITWLPDENIQIVDSVSDWKQTITLVAQPLLMKEAITESYINAIFHGYQEAGAYYVLAPGLANIFSDDERHPALLKAASIESIQTVING